MHTFGSVMTGFGRWVLKLTTPKIVSALVTTCSRGRKSSTQPLFSFTVATVGLASLTPMDTSEAMLIRPPGSDDSHVGSSGSSMNMKNLLATPAAWV